MSAAVLFQPALMGPPREKKAVPAKAGSRRGGGRGSQDKAARAR
jgi:hypothetical protein